ncbi:MAG: 4Fe-4S dicluster domain-containing protein, partial [bacterium]|nr:4Fe-4S dicluster domain-containing protein [bacterium]
LSEGQEGEEEEEFEMPEVPLRTIPVKAPINSSRPIAPYEDVKEIIKNQDRIAVAECFCVKLREAMMEEDVDQPREVCLLLGFYADYYIEQGWGRKISKEEALEILDIAEEAGLVHQIPNCEDPGAICNCGPNSCGQLQVLQLIPNPAEFVKTNYFAEVDHDLCTGCETCQERCPMFALSITSEEVALIDLEKCIGCGLCVSTCPVDALSLVSKKEEERQDPGASCEFMRSSKDIEGSISQ